MKPLIVYSPSTKPFIGEFSHYMELEVVEPPTIELLSKARSIESAIAIGGGSVIDTAKVLARKVTAIPTTYCGASCTSHAVVWSKAEKLRVQTAKPDIILRPEFLPLALTRALLDSQYDMYAHAYESLISKRRTHQSINLALQAFFEKDLLKASIYAGEALELTGTNIIHALSYPLTTEYGYSHSRAVRYILEKLQIPTPITRPIAGLMPTHLSYPDKDPQINVTTVLLKAQAYPQIRDYIVYPNINWKEIEEQLRK